MQTLRRLNDPTTYYGLSWRGWLAGAVAASVLYAAVRLSPLSFKPTLSLSLFVLMLAGMLLYNLSGQALGIGRYLLAIIAWQLAPKHHRAPDTRHPVRGGVLVDAVPLTLTTRGAGDVPWADGGELIEGPS